MASTDRDCARFKLSTAETQKRRALFWELFITDCWQVSLTSSILHRVITIRCACRHWRLDGYRHLSSISLTLNFLPIRMRHLPTTVPRNLAVSLMLFIHA